MDALGMIEVTSIAAGIEAGDAMLKTAMVSLITAQPVCAGKYIVMVGGDVASVTSSVEAGKDMCGNLLVESLIIANVHPQVFKAINCTAEMTGDIATGVIETFSLVAAVNAADAAVKAADVTLVEVRLGRGLGGKSFVVMTGDVSAVRFAVSTGIDLEACKGMVVKSVVIPSPHKDLLNALL